MSRNQTFALQNHSTQLAGASIKNLCRCFVLRIPPPFAFHEKHVSLGLAGLSLGGFTYRTYSSISIDGMIEQCRTSKFLGEGKDSAHSELRPRLRLNARLLLLGLDEQILDASVRPG